MPRPRVVSANKRPYKHVEISDGDWVNIKQKLDYGEASALYDATYRSSVGGASTGSNREVRMSEFNMQRLLIYVLDWSFIDDENKPLALNAENIRRLDPETANEIHEAITAIEDENARMEREAKNGVAVSQPAVLKGKSPD